MPGALSFAVSHTPPPLGALWCDAPAIFQILLMNVGTFPSLLLLCVILWIHYLHTTVFPACGCCAGGWGLFDAPEGSER